MKKVFYFILASVWLTASAQIKVLLWKDSAEVFTYSMGDEFDSAPVDQKKWKKGLGGRSVLMSQDLAFTDDMIRFSDGKLLLLADSCNSFFKLQDWEIDSNHLKKSKSTISENMWRVRYRAGGIVSKEKLHYGLHELRFKVQRNQGTWPAFWFYGGNGNEEIDAFELKGEKGSALHIDVHCPEGCDHGYRKRALSWPLSYGGWMPSSSDLDLDYQVVTLDWRRDELLFYLNGFPLAYFKGSFELPMNLRLNNSVAKDGAAFSPGPSVNNAWPDTFSVDYYRYWQKLVSDTIDLLPASKSSQPGFGPARPVKSGGPLFNRRRARSFYGEFNLVLNKQHELSLIPSSECVQHYESLILINNDKTKACDLSEAGCSFNVEVGFAEIRLVQKGQATRSVYLRIRG